MEADSHILEYERLRLMLDAMPFTCHLWNRNCEIFDCNEENVRLFKAKSKQEFMDNFHLYSPEYQPDGILSSKKAERCIKRAFEEGRFEFEWMHNTADGEKIPCEVILVRVPYGDDYVVSGYMRDLRDHHEFMGQIGKQDALMRTVNRIASILLQSETSEFENDLHKCMGAIAEAVRADRVYIWKNHTVNGALFGSQIYEWSGAAEPRLPHTGIAYRKKLPDWEGTLSEGLCVNGPLRDMSPEAQALLRPDGARSVFAVPVFMREEFWGFVGFDDCHGERTFSENEASILRSAGLLIGNAMLRHEMTLDTQTTAIQLEAALNASKAANQAKTNFLSNMSHEIRTPMNAILGIAELLAHERLSDRQARYVNDITSSAQLLLGIINDILDLSKIQAGKLTLNPVNYNFRGFLDNVSSMFRFVAQQKGLEFTVERTGDIPAYLLGDDNRLRQVLTNICGNAVKFTEKGHVKLAVTASGGRLSFAVADTGKGIRKEEIPLLFDAFQQEDQVKNRGVVGTGLGLAISKSFVEMMGGTIAVESEVGHGTVFTVTIPLVGGCEEEITAVAGGGERVYAPTANVLIVDDIDFNLKVARGLLRLSGIDAKTVTSGKDAIQAVQQEDFDLVFMDHMMPEMDGVEATAAIRKLGLKYKKLPIVALTANAVPGAREMFLANSLNDFLAKPVDNSELNRVLTQWLPPEKLEDAPDDADSADGMDGVPDGFLTTLSTIDGLNPEIGLSRVSGALDMYHDALEMFCKTLPKESGQMSTFLNGGDIRGFAITVHAMKSALSTVGAMQLSETAAKLETASKNNDMIFCTDRFPAFQDELLSLHGRLKTVFPEAEDGGAKGKGDMAALRENAEKALAAADEFDNDAGLKALKTVSGYDFGEHTPLLERALAAFEEFDFDIAAESLREILKGV